MRQPTEVLASRADVRRVPSLCRFEPLVVGLLMALACGAKTGLFVAEHPGPPDGFSVTGTCQCGMCTSDPWCQRGFDTVRPLDDGTCPPGARPATAISTVDRFGHEGARMFCDPDTVVGGDPSSLVGVEEIDGCFLTPDAYAALPPPSNFIDFREADRTGHCGSASFYACDTHGPLGPLPGGHDDTLTTPHADDWLHVLQCPKDQIFSQPTFCGAGASPSAARAGLLPALGAYCAMWGDEISISADHSFGWRCFTSAVTTPGPSDSCSTTIIQSGGGVIHLTPDPGPTPLGHQLVVSAGSTLHVVAAGGAAAETTVSGNAAALLGPVGFALTDLRLKVGALSVGGAAFTEGVIGLQTPWIGTIGPRGDVTVRAATVHAYLFFKIDGRPFTVSAVGDVDPVGTVSGGHVSLRAHFNNDVERQDIELRLILDDARPRPTVRLVADGPLTPECSSPAGATFAAHATPTFNGPAGPVVWSLHDGTNKVVRAGALATRWDLPLRRPSDPPATLSVVASSGPLEAADSARVQVVDTVAPVVSGVTITVPCGWGSTLPSPGTDPHPPNTPLCQTFRFHVKDLCDPNPTILTTELDAFDDRNTRVVMDQSPACLTATPDFLDDRISRLRYELYWSARDHWGVVSRTWRTIFRVRADPPTATCRAPRSVQILSSAPFP